jgi:hypothetical protein
VTRVCTVCTHDQAHSINVALVHHEPYRALARQYGVSKDALRRHSREHIPQLLLEATRALEVADADGLLEQVRDLQRRALSILDQAEDAGELRTALAAIAQARGNLELLGKLAGELAQEGQVNIHLNAEWLEIRALIFDALSSHPRALHDVRTALEGVNGNESG